MDIKWLNSYFPHDIEITDRQQSTEELFCIQCVFPLGAVHPKWSTLLRLLILAGGKKKKKNVPHEWGTCWYLFPKSKLASILNSGTCSQKLWVIPSIPLKRQKVKKKIALLVVNSLAVLQVSDWSDGFNLEVVELNRVNPSCCLPLLCLVLGLTVAEDTGDCCLREEIL